MRKHEKGLLITAFTIGFILWGMGSKAFGDTEIDLGDDTKASQAPVTTQKPSTGTQATKAASTPTPASQEIEMEDHTQPATQTAPEASPTVTEVNGVFKMKDMYEAGIQSYKEKDYHDAVIRLKKALEIHDPYTPKFYYAEANAMLGVIYQFHVIHYNWAYRYYRAALKYEPRNATARRHIKQVYKYRNRE